MTLAAFRCSSFLKNIFRPLPVRYLSTETGVLDEIDKLVKNNKVVVFMKGNPEQPKCGFSNAVVQILRMHGVTYDAHDVLQNDKIRNGIKEYSNWPTIPQIFINSEFVGGCDIMLQLHQTGNLITELEKAGIKSALSDSSSAACNKSDNSS